MNAYDKYVGLKLDLADGVMTVTLSNPGRKNAMTPTMSAELTTIWDDLQVDPDVRVIVFTGEGGDFCSGVDLTSLSGTQEATALAPVNRVSRNARKHVLGIVECEKPVIAKVRGVAYGVGANMALACDMVFAAPGSRFCDPHVKIGLVAGDGGVLLWPLLCGGRKAKEFLMTGDPVGAEEAAAIGLINRVIPDDQLDEHVRAFSEKLKDLPPHAVNYTKVSLNLAMRQMTGAAFEASLGYELYCMKMDDSREAVAAAREKRKGRYLGR
jgi:enoyl-CoA hydratase